MTGVSGREREDAISNLFIDTTRSKMAFSRIEELMMRGWEASFCRALLILGPSRCGKTHIFTEWLRRRRETEASFKAVVTEVPQGCSLRQMAAQLLENLGDPDPDYGSQGEKTRRIAQLATGYDVIVIDELQRLVDDNTGKVKKDVSGWLTNLLNRRLCPLILVGELHADLVLQGNMYLVGRTLGQVLVAPYSWHDERDRLEFRAFLNLVDQELGMPVRSELGATDTALRVHSFSGGRIGQAAHLIDEARSVARRLGRPKLTDDVFAEAVDLLRVGFTRSEANPFRIGIPMPGDEPPPHVREAVIPIRGGRRRTAP